MQRIYADPGHRGKGIATQVLSGLEHWAGELGYKRCILETGVNQPEAISLYKKNDYRITPNYGQYEGVKIVIVLKSFLIQRIYFDLMADREK